MKQVQHSLVLLILFMSMGRWVVADQVPFGPAPLGLSLFFHNGHISPIALVGDAPRYLQEIDIVATVATPTYRGIEPIIENSDLSALDWSGITMVEEDWRPDVDGTFIRQRFYRGAKWMEDKSEFHLVPSDDTGKLLSEPLLAKAGSDDRWKEADDGFVRRFVARQITRGCPAMRDCFVATQFTTQGLGSF